MNGNLEYQRHLTLVDEFKTGNPRIPKIHWHRELEKINFSKQPNNLNPKLNDEPLALIEDVDVERLLNNMTDADKEMFGKRQLYNSSFSDQRVSRVWAHWLDGVKLIPPTILIFDQQYIDTVCRGTYCSDEFRPVEGKHRLNVACAFNAKTVPIIVFERQLETIIARLNM